MSLNKHKVFSCERCHKKLRVPVKSGKRLLVDCPSCGHENQVSFQGLLWTLTSSKRNRILSFSVGLLLLLLLLMLTVGQMHSQGLKQLENIENKPLQNAPLKII